MTDARRFCGKCGTELAPGAGFCPRCGAAFTGAGGPPPQPPAQAPWSPPAPPAAGPTGAYPSASPPTPRTSGAGPLIGAIVAVVLVLIVLGGIGAYIAWQKLVPHPPKVVPSGIPVAGDQAGTQAPGTEGSSPATVSLDDLVGQWSVQEAVLDGPPPDTLTFERQGDLVVGSLSDRINTRLELGLVDGAWRGNYYDPQVVQQAADAQLTGGNRLEVHATDRDGARNLLIIATRGGSGPGPTGSAGPVTSPQQAVDLVAAMPDIKEWMAQVQAAAQQGERRSAHVDVDSEEPNMYIVHVYEMVDDEMGGHTATYGWYEVHKQTGEVKSTTLEG